MRLNSKRTAPIKKRRKVKPRKYTLSKLRARQNQGTLSDSDLRRIYSEAAKKGASTSRLRDLIKRRRRKPAKRTAKRGAMSTKDMAKKLRTVREGVKRGTGRGVMSDKDMAMYRRMMARRKK